MRQISFLKELGYSIVAVHGGDKAKGKRKKRRPLDSKYPVHLILKSKKATGALSMLRGKNRNHIENLIHRKAKKFNIAVEGYANVGNHLHFKIRFKRRADFQRYLKSITSLIARFVTGARRGKKFGQFWCYLAYTKLIKVWTQEKNLNRYIVANNIEAEFGYAARENYLRDGNSS